MKEESIASISALQLIHFYRQNISPLKGYSCAHAHLNGGMTCSGYGIHVFESYSFSEAITMMRVRFLACNVSANLINPIETEMKPMCCGCSC